MSAKCGKVQYRTELAAMVTLSKIRVQHKPGRREHRVYRCRDCHQWHLTSKGKASL